MSEGQLAKMNQRHKNFALSLSGVSIDKFFNSLGALRMNEEKLEKLTSDLTRIKRLETFIAQAEGIKPSCVRGFIEDYKHVIPTETFLAAIQQGCKDSITELDELKKNFENA